MLSSVAEAGREERNSEVCCAGPSDTAPGEEGNVTHDILIFWWLQTLRLRMVGHYFSCNWVIVTMISILNILVGKRVLNRFFMSCKASLIKNRSEKGIACELTGTGIRLLCCTLLLRKKSICAGDCAYNMGLSELAASAFPSQQM
jgi:hypothetical protein